MINTIFYFPSSLTFLDYTDMLSSNQIADRTIVFADAQKAIYKGGKKYGGLSDKEFHDLADTLDTNSWIADELASIKGDIQTANGVISTLNGSIQTINSNLNQTIDNIDGDIKTKIQSLFRDSTWLQSNFPQGYTNWDSSWNTNLEAYLTQVGYWDIDSTTGQKTSKWSKLQNDINSISLQVASLTGDETMSQTMETTIESMIAADIASLNLNTTYATISSVNGISSDVDKSKDIIEWLYAGLTAQSGADKTFALLSAMTKSAFTSAISDIRTQVDKVANGDFVAQTEVSSKVGNTIATMLAQSSSDNALAALSAKADANSDDIAAIVLGMTGSSSTANISTSVSTALNNLTSGLASSSDITSAKSEIYSAISAKDTNDNFISLAALKTQSDADHASVSALATNKADVAGVVAKSELGTAVASLFASTGDAQNPTAKANVVAVVKDNKSSLQLTAQDVNIDGYLTAGNATFKGDVEATSFTTGSSSETGITVLSGEFDPTDPTVNTHKAYFAYDSEQGGITMWFYCNDVWKRIDLSNASVSEDPNAFAQGVLYTGTVWGDYLLSDPTFTRTYYSRVYDKYYNTTSAIDANLLTATGYKFNTGWIPLAPSTNSWMYREDPTVEMGTRSEVIYIPLANVTSNLNLGQRPLYIFPPRLCPTDQALYNGGVRTNPLFDGDNISTSLIYKYIYQNGVRTVLPYMHYYYIADEVLWHAAGDPLPSGIVAQNSQTPSTSDAFAYVVWKIGDRTAIVKNMSSGDKFCIAGGNGNVYEASTLGKQIVYQVSPWANYTSNINRYNANGTLIDEAGLRGTLLNSYEDGWHGRTVLNIDHYIYNSGYSGVSYIDPDYATQVGHIWHCIPDVPYTYPITQPEQSNS